MHSPQTRTVLTALVDSGEWRYGYELMQATGVGAGTLYPMLARLARRGLLETRWSDGEQAGPRRHLYRLTGEGVREARAVTGEDRPPQTLRSRPA